MSIGTEWNAHTAFADTQKTAFDAWALCVRRKWLILFMVLVGIGGGVTYWHQAPKVYEAMAQVLVIRRQHDSEMPLKTVRGEVVSENSLSSHMVLIKSPVIVEAAVQLLPLDQKRSLAQNLFTQELDPEGKLTPEQASRIGDKIRGGLKVIRAGGKDAPDANVMQITYRSYKPEDSQAVVQALVDAYDSFLSMNYRDINADTVRFITEAKDELDAKLRSQRDAYDDFREASPLRWVMEDQLSIPEMRMREIQKVLTEIMLTRGQTLARKEAIEQCIRDGASRESLVLMVDKLNQARQMRPVNAMAALEDQLFPFMVEEQVLRETLGENHPSVKAVQQKIQAMRSFIENKRFEVEAAEEENPNKADFVTTYLESLDNELADAEARERTLLAEYKRLEEEAGLLTKYRIREERLRKEIEPTERTFEAVLQKVNELNLVKDRNEGYNNKVIAPPKGGYVVEPNIFKSLGVFGFAGVLLGFGLAYLVDISDKSFRGPEEVRQELGVPILGHIPILVPHSPRRRKNQPASKVGPFVLTYHQPKSTMAESYRAVRTALNFGTRGEGHKVIQVTSPDPGDGKTTLAANLAVSVAQSGKRILLIDADFRRPRVHRAFGLEQEIGLSSVIKGVAELPDAIQSTEVPNLYVLPCGPRPSNPSELLTQQQFKDLIELVREQYDIVLIDTPPALAVTDPCVVAPRVDGVLLLLRITKHVRPHARRAVEILESLGANMLGLVINGVGGGRPSMGYGFGQQYGYRYASSSGYYDHPYSEDRYGEYYSEEDDEEKLRQHAAVAPNGNGLAVNNGSRQVDSDEVAGEPNS